MNKLTLQQAYLKNMRLNKMGLLNKALTVLSSYGEVNVLKDTELTFKIKCDSLNSSCHFFVTSDEIHFYYKTFLLRVFTSRNTGVLKLAFDCPTKELQWWLEDIKHHKGYVLYSNHSKDTAIIVDQKEITRFRSEGLLYDFIIYNKIFHSGESPSEMKKEIRHPPAQSKSGKFNF